MKSWFLILDEVEKEFFFYLEKYNQRRLTNSWKEFEKGRCTNWIVSQRLESSISLYKTTGKHLMNTILWLRSFSELHFVIFFLHVFQNVFNIALLKRNFITIWLRRVASWKSTSVWVLDSRGLRLTGLLIAFSARQISQCQQAGGTLQDTEPYGDANQNLVSKSAVSDC